MRVIRMICADTHRFTLIDFPFEHMANLCNYTYTPVSSELLLKIEKCHK